MSLAPFEDAQGSGPLLPRLLWPFTPQRLMLPGNGVEPPMVTQNSTQRMTLALSLSDDEALQQVLTDGAGKMLVGETSSFLSWAAAASGVPEVTPSGSINATDFQHQTTHPFAPRIWNALHAQQAAVDVLCTPDVLAFPWTRWLPEIATCQCMPIASIGGSVQPVEAAAPQSTAKDVYAQLPGYELLYAQKSSPDSLAQTRTVWQQRGYRNVISLSYDLVDSTASMARMGAEAYSQMLTHLHATYASIAANWRGQMNAPQGDDGCMCYFGAVSADEHAGPAALRAALEMQSAALRHGWSVRIGIASGWVAMDAAQPVGLTVHLAARLQKLAKTGAIYVNDALAKACASEFDFLLLAQDAKLKGFDDSQQVMELVSAWRPRDAMHRANMFAHDAIFMGRISLLATLSNTWHKVLQGQGSDVLIIGQPGMGKSGLVRHWQATLSGQAQFVIRCGPHDYRHPFASLAQWLTQLIGFTPMGTREEQLARLQERLLHLPSWAPHLPALAYLFDLPLPNVSMVLEDPIAQHQHVIKAVMQWVISRSHTEPVLFVVEDYQWIDASTAACAHALRDLAAQGQKIMLIVTQRPPLERQPLYATRGLSLQMEPLSAQETQQVIAALSPQIHADSTLMALIEVRARGIPLFLKESVRLFSTAGYQERLQTARRLGVGMPVPDSLQDLLMQRLDQLGSARQVAQLASVLGQQFSWEMLKAVATALNLALDQGVDLERVRQTLEQEDVWITSSRSDLQQLEFSHALLRDVAYQSMWETDRKQIHAVAAKILQSRQLHDPEASAPALGRHLAAAGEIELAVDHLLSTGKQSKKKGAHIVATQTMETALELLELLAPGDTTKLRRIEAHLALAGQIVITQGYSSKAVSEHYGQALQLSEGLGDHKAILRAQLGLESIYFMRGDFAMAHRLLDAAQVTASHVKHPLAMLQYDWAQANLMFYEGKLVECAALMQTCIGWCEAYGLGHDLIQNPHVMATMYRAFSLCCLGRTDDALALASKGCDLAAQSTNRLTRLQAFGIAAMVEYGCGRWAQTLARAERAIASCQPGEYSLWLAHAGVMRGAALTQLGSLPDGLALMRASHASWAEHGGTLTRSYYWCLEAEILKNSGDSAGAMHAITQAQKIQEAISERYFDTEVRRIAASLELDQASDPGVKAQAYQALLLAFGDATHRQLHGLALRLAVSLFEYAKHAPLNTAPLPVAPKDRLMQCLAQVQGREATADILRARFCIESPHSADVLYIDHYKRA